MAKIKQNFQAEIQQLLHLMIHSLYSHREIFLRELISNASDAMDKLKFLALTQDGLVEPGHPYEIRLEPDPQARTLRIIDRGIGMDREEVIQNLGTIAHSGTKAFLAQAQQWKDKPELIGQFGVGFYSSFMVSDKVIVHTQKAGSTHGVLWESQGDGTFTIDDVPRPEGVGTTLILHLKGRGEGDDDAQNLSEDGGGKDKDSRSVGLDSQDHQDFTDSWELKQLVKKYSDFISYPIKMKVEKKKPAPASEQAQEQVQAQTQQDQEAQDGATKAGDGGSKAEKEMITVWEDEVLNSQKALWLKNPSEVSEEEYKEFYRHVSHDWSDPSKTIHFKAEGTMEYNALVFLPSQRPWNYYYKDQEFGLSLYIKRVFIMADNKDLLPSYMRFVKGLVDSSDLSLNVSREMLQQDRQVIAIKKSLTNKIFSALKDFLSKDRTGYEKFWAQFGATLKEGYSIDPTMKDKLTEVCLYRSTHSEGWTTLEEYWNRKKSDQKQIYFITGDSMEQVQKSPYLERLKEKEFEVLLMVDPIDEWAAEALREYKEFPLKNVVKEDLALDSEEEKKAKEQENKQLQEKFKDLMANIQSALVENVKEVRLSDRLTESPVCLVSGSYDPSAHMEKLMAKLGGARGIEGMGAKSKRILEINPKHPLFDKMLKAPTEKQKDWAEILWAQALLNEGSDLPNPAKFSQQIAHLMMNVDLS